MMEKVPQHYVIDVVLNITDTDECSRELNKAFHEGMCRSMEPIGWMFIGLAIVTTATVLTILFNKKGQKSRQAKGKSPITNNDIQSIKIIQELAQIYKTVDQKMSKYK